MKKQLEFIENQLKQIEKELEELIVRNGDEDVNSLQSIRGTGRKTAIALPVYTKGMNGFDSFTVNCPLVSGFVRVLFSREQAWKDGGKICKPGMGHIRMLLYMCARLAKKYNKACKELYKRLLAKWKAKKLSLIAVTNKLLKQAFAIVKNKSVHVENYAWKIWFLTQFFARNEAHRLTLNNYMIIALLNTFLNPVLPIHLSVNQHNKPFLCVFVATNRIFKELYISMLENHVVIKKL